MSSDLEEDDSNNWQQVQHLEQASGDMTLRMTKDPLPKKWNRADTVIACTSLLNLRHPAGAIAPALLKRQKSTLNILRESDIIPAQALLPPKAGGDQSVPQLKAGGDHNVPQHLKATFEVVKRLLEAIVLTMTRWPVISDQKYPMVDEVCRVAIEAQDRQRALAGAPVGTPSVCQLPCGPSLKIDPQTQYAVSALSVFFSVSCSSIGLMMILNPRNIHS